MRSFFAISLLLSASCSTPEPDLRYLRPDREFVLGEPDQIPRGKVGCRQMLDSFCSTLYSPEAQGNLRVGQGSGAHPVLQGRTKNDFTGAYFAYAMAKLRSARELPADFLRILERNNYFEVLKQALNRGPRSRMSLDRRVTSLRRDRRLEQLWDTAMAETVLKRMSRKFPGYHQMREDLIPLEQSVERRRMRMELISEVSRAIWSRDKNWAKVEASFEMLKTRFLAVVDALDIPEEIRTRWLDRLRSVRLVIPGAIPAIADGECSTTQANAYYYSQLNLITVCAGDFNSVDILQTVAHELGHVLDLERSMYVFQKQSAFGKSLSDLRGQVCAPSAFSCESWKRFQEGFESRLEGLQAYSAELPEFQRCLKKRRTAKEPQPDDIRRLAESEISEQVSELARSGVFLRIIKEQVPMANGRLARNPNYLNPCSYRLWSHGEETVDDELTQLLFFTAEYRCSPHRAPTERLRAAIARSEELALEVSAATIRMEGEFSSREDLEEEGFASSPNERFADVLGSYAFAAHLGQVRDTVSRRYRFLASSSWQCDRPSLESLYPAEDSVQQAFVFDPHTKGEARRTEMFTRPVRQALSCDQDFQFESCELKFRKNLKWKDQS